MTEEENIKRLADWLGCAHGTLNGIRWVLPVGRTTFVEGWNPYASHDHCRMLEDEVERRGLQTTYGNLLVLVLQGSPRRFITTFDIAYATPAQRCAAVLRLIGEKDGHRRV